MGSRGNSIGERDSGTDSNKGECCNFMEGTEADSNGVQTANMYTDLQQNMAKLNCDRAMSTTDMRGHNPIGGNVIQQFSLAGDIMNTATTCNTEVKRDLKPWLEMENSVTKLPSSTTQFREMYPSNIMDQERRMAGSTCLTMLLGPYPSERNVSNGHAVYNLPGMFASSFDPNAEERNQLLLKAHAVNQTQPKPRQLLPKHHPHPLLQLQDVAKQSPPLSNKPEPSKDASPQVPIRVARPPPIEGRGRNQLLPRYWPRITDQELQQITARDSNSTITPLFEKMLSASDAGRIGRLVLPKACAEAYFPPISQPEGVALKIQDVSGKDWVFQFRFWPNNNSRMYVLEGVTPCIQSMQLQAGDTVTFSRLDPEGKLVMGYRRAPSSLSSQEITGSSGAPPTMVGNAGNLESFPTITSLSGYLSPSAKNSEVRNDGHLNVSDTGYGWYKADKSEPKAKEDSFFQPLIHGDKKKLRPVASKNKRPACMDESIEFRITWEEAQDLLRSPPNGSPNIVSIEGYDFEEYEEPPVFGKRTIFTSSNLGPGEDQWAQCDDCGNWRKVPADVFLPTRWVCADNVWDIERNFCNAPQEVNNEEIECLIQHFKDAKKQEPAEPLKANETLSSLEALANAVTTGENSTPAATTKHPRHRPGCTCIVCIQPPSGKGPKHKPTCICNVCMTVKRRFKTLMMRRKKRQSEKEAENAARKKRLLTKEDVGDVSNGGKWKNDSYPSSEGFLQGNLVMSFPNALPKIPNFPTNTNGYRFPSNVSFQVPYASRAINFVDDLKGHIDLNNQPDKDDEKNRNAFRVSMMRLLQNASYPLDSYLKEQGLTSLMSAQLLHPSMSFRNSAEWEADRQNLNQPVMALSSERPQEGLYMSLGISRFSTTGSLPNSCT